MAFSRKALVLSARRFVLVVMLIYLLDVDGFDTVVIMNDVDGAVGLAETNGSVTFPLAFEGMVLEAGQGSCGVQAVDLDQVRPDGELPKDVLGDLGELFSGGAGELESHWDSVP